MTAIPVYILAGGQCSRFGGDKALAEIGGSTMIARVADQWATRASRVTAVAERVDKYASCGLRTIADRQPGLGPIGGLLTALEDCGTGWLLLAACDAVVLDPGLPERLFSAVSDEVKVVALKGTRWETMPALYHCSILPVVRTSVAKGQFAVWRIIEQVPHRAIGYPNDQAVIGQINTREDLRRLRESSQL